MADKSGQTAPHGMESFDCGDNDTLGALSPEQQHKLNQFKVGTVKIFDSVLSF